MLVGSGVGVGVRVGVGVGVGPVLLFLVRSMGLLLLTSLKSPRPSKQWRDGAVVGVGGGGGEVRQILTDSSEAHQL